MGWESTRQCRSVREKPPCPFHSYTLLHKGWFKSSNLCNSDISKMCLNILFDYTFQRVSNNHKLREHDLLRSHFMWCILQIIHSWDFGERPNSAVLRLKYMSMDCIFPALGMHCFVIGSPIISLPRSAKNSWDSHLKLNIPKSLPKETNLYV